MVYLQGRYFGYKVVALWLSIGVSIIFVGEVFSAERDRKVVYLRNLIEQAKDELTLLENSEELSSDFVRNRAPMYFKRGQSPKSVSVPADQRESVHASIAGRQTGRLIQAKAKYGNSLTNLEQLERRYESRLDHAAPVVRPLKSQKKLGLSHTNREQLERKYESNLNLAAPVARPLKSQKKLGLSLSNLNQASAKVGPSYSSQQKIMGQKFIFGTEIEQMFRTVVIPKIRGQRPSLEEIRLISASPTPGMPSQEFSAPQNKVEYRFSFTAVDRIQGGEKVKAFCKVSGLKKELSSANLKTHGLTCERVVNEGSRQSRVRYYP